MFLVDRLSKKFTIASSKVAFAICSMLATLLICAALLTPGWRNADANVRLLSSKETVIQQQFNIKLSTGLFAFACNYGIDHGPSGPANNMPRLIEGSDLCKAWAEAQPIYEHIASGLLSTALACSLANFFWNLLAKRSVLIRVLPLLALLPTFLLCSALVLFLIFSCRDTGLTAIRLEQSAELTNTGCSIGYSYTLGLLAFLCSLASALIGAVIAAKVALKRQHHHLKHSKQKPSQQINQLKKKQQRSN